MMCYKYPLNLSYVFEIAGTDDYYSGKLLCLGTYEIVEIIRTQSRRPKLSNIHNICADIK